MKIIELQANNVKCLQAVTINPDGSTVIIGGANGAGKSTVLDCITMALAGAAGLPRQAIRTGEDSAEIILTIAEDDSQLVVTRKFRDGGKSTLEVKQIDSDGYAVKVTSPQKMLDTLYSAIAFDPLAFTRQAPQKQIETLRKVLGIDVSDIDAASAKAFAKRTDVNRDLKRLKAAADTLTRHKDVPAEEVSVADLVKELQAAQAHNRTKATAERAFRECDSKVASITRSMKQTQAEISDLTRDLEEQDKQRKACRTETERLVAEFRAIVEKDVYPLHEQIENADAVNIKVRENKARAIAVEAMNVSQTESEGLTDYIESLRSERIEKLADADWPVDGLSFGDDGVTLDDLPFEQCSSAEQLRISTAIGLAQNPKLKVMLIHDGSLLDDQSLAAVAKMAEENDSQVWIERVGKGDECTVVIEDGAVVETVEAEEFATETNYELAE